MLKKHVYRHKWDLVFQGNRLPADHSHERSNLIWAQNEEQEGPWVAHLRKIVCKIRWSIILTNIYCRANQEWQCCNTLFAIAK